MRAASRVRASVTGVAALVALLVAGGCSVPRDDAARPLDVRALPQLTPRPNCVPLGDADTETVPVYLVARLESTQFVTPVERQVESPVTPVGVLQRLVDCGPTTDESNRGITTDVPETSVEAFVEVGNGDYELRLTPLAKRDGQPVDELSSLAVAQFFFTATNNFPNVRGLRFVVNGEPKAASTDGATKAPGEFVRWSDFPNSQPTTTTTTTTTTSSTTTSEPPPPSTEDEPEAPPTTEE